MPRSLTWNASAQLAKATLYMYTHFNASHYVCISAYLHTFRCTLNVCYAFPCACSEISRKMCGLTKRCHLKEDRSVSGYKRGELLCDNFPANQMGLYCVYTPLTVVYKLGSVFPCVGEAWPLGSIVLQKNVGTGLCQCVLMGGQQYILRNLGMTYLTFTPERS